MKHALLQAARSVRLSFRLHSPFWERELKRYGIYADEFAEDKATGNLILRALGATLPRSRAALLATYFEARHIGDACRFYNGADGDLFAEMAGLRFRIDASGEFAMLVELFGRGCYDFHADRPVAVWDIGMNAGYASLAFARNPNVVQVFGYEPFRRTFEAAEYNFALNPALRGKIQPVPKGVGANAERIPSFTTMTFAKPTAFLKPSPPTIPAFPRKLSLRPRPPRWTG